MTTDVQTIFEKESIIPDILAPGTKVPRNLKVIWPNAKLEKPGQMIERDATQPQPTLFVEPSVSFFLPISHAELRSMANNLSGF